jgi:hypothetical protein
MVEVGYPSAPRKEWSSGVPQLDVRDDPNNNLALAGQRQ